MTITVKCNICNAVLVNANGPDLCQEDADNYKVSCSCTVDGPFQAYDGDGNPLPMDYSNISSVLSD